MSYETLVRRTDEEVRATSLYLHALRILPRPPAAEPVKRRVFALGSRSGRGAGASRFTPGREPRSTAGSPRGE
jgi:hypothetical protein